MLVYATGCLVRRLDHKVNQGFAGISEVRFWLAYPAKRLDHGRKGDKNR